MMVRVSGQEHKHILVPDASTTEDRRWMQKAITLAQRAKGTTFPNPSVGAVIVKNGAIVGMGATSCCGGPHAERSALAQAGPKAKNATLYVTLEPCCHHGRTPPCTDAIIAAGISRVFLSVRDPNPLVAGKGVAHLQRNGIDTHEGVLHNKAHAINEDFFWSIKHKLPWITLKLALTLDGFAADSDGESKWISSPQARRFVHELRRRHAIVAVGRGTLVKDNPQLTVRHIRADSPARVVFLSDCRDLAQDSNFVRGAGLVRTIAVVPEGKPGSRIRRPDHVEIWRTGRGTKLASFTEFLSMAHKDGLTSILVEGGPAMGSFLLENRLVNRIYLMHGNKILGAGINAITFDRGLKMHNGMTLETIEHRRMGDTMTTTGIPVWST